ncbi:MAG: hypothetical protein Q7S98_02305 [Deltaproteobacteria bacterium]|nr:hypothetical protein [Deltaproteobacteria bacterium]
MSSEKDNIVLWHPSKKKFYENFFFELHDPEGRFSFLGRYTLQNQGGETNGSVWGLFFDRVQKKQIVLHNDFAADKVVTEADFFFLDIGGSAIYHHGARAHLKEADQEMEWEFSWEPEGESLLLLPPLAYKLPFPKTKILTPNPRLRLSGRLRINGETFILQDAVGQQSHAWGEEIHPSYHWGFANQFEGADAVFEIGTTPLPRPIRGLSFVSAIVLRLDQKTYLFNGPTDWFRNKNSISPTHWHFEAKNKKTLLVGDLEAKPEEFAKLPFEQKTLLAQLHLELFTKEGDRWTKNRELVSNNASFEYDAKAFC